MKMWRMLALVLGMIVGASALWAQSAQSWQSLNNPAGFNAGAMLLLTDGSVLVHSEQNNSQNWYKFTPDINGSYVNGTWSQVATMPAGYAPLYFGSAVLPDGRVIVEGGEYNNLQAAWTNLGAVYDPVGNTWTSVAPPSGWHHIGDAPATVLANGTYMQSDCCGKVAALLDPVSLTWTPTGAGKFDVYDEEGFTLLPGGNVLTVDAYVFQYDASGTNSEIYNAGSGTWSSAGSTGVQLWDSCGGQNGASYEVGPAVLRPDGTVFATGTNGCGNGHTSIFDTKTGTWTPGPDFNGGYDVADGPAALEPSGNVVVMTSPGVFQHGAKFFEWDGSSLNSLPGPPSASSDSSFYGHFLVLPTGQLMFSDFSNDIEIYNPAGSANPAWAPAVTKSPKNVRAGGSYSLSGTLLNGMSQGAAYGDDYQSATNYPIIRIVNNTTGHVFYCRTHDRNNAGVATGSAVITTAFDVPANIESGASQLFVAANGIASAPVAVSVQ